MTKLGLMRRKKRLKLRELAAMCNVTASTVHDTEVRGIRTIRTAKRYAEALDCDWRELLD